MGRSWGSLVDLVWHEPVLIIAVLGGDLCVELPAALRGFGWAAKVVAAVAGAVAGHGCAVQDHSGRPALVEAPRRLGAVCSCCCCGMCGCGRVCCLYSGNPPLDCRRVVGSRDRC
jgi:hypothetical protein